MKEKYGDLIHLNLPFDISKVKNQCVKCVRAQLKKYKAHVDESTDNTFGDRFVVSCKGILKHPINPASRAIYDDETWRALHTLTDKSLWANTFLKDPITGKPWETRTYQEQVLNCTSRRKVLRISRRTGKCIHAKSLVYSEEGAIPVEELYSSKKPVRIASFNEDTLSTEFSDATIRFNGEKPVFLLRTKNGRETIVTDNHPFLVNKFNNEAEWVELKDIVVGDKIAVPSTYSHLSIKNPVLLGDNKARLLGYLTGDGGTSYRVLVRFSNIDSIILSDMSEILKEFNCKLKHSSGCDYNIVTDDGHDRGPGIWIDGSENLVNRFVTKHGLRCLAKNKKVPDAILRANNSDVAQFLAAYWDCDGWASINKKVYNKKKQPNVEIGICSASKELMLQTKHLLLRFGISSSLRHKKVKYKEGFNDAWQLTMAGKDSIEKFKQYIPVKLKKEAVDKVYAIVKDRSARLIKEQYFWDDIVEIKHLGEEPTYDLTVPSNHTLIADDIISHNTATVCIDILFNAITQPKQKLLVTGPQKTHVKEIFTRIREFLDTSPELKSMVTRDVVSPHSEMEFTNGSRIRGFAAGEAGKGASSAIRGQDADKIYCFPKGTLVNTSKFRVKPIEELVVGDNILGGNEEHITIGKITNTGTRYKEVIKLNTLLGSVICTPDHPFFNGKEDIPASKATEVIFSLFYSSDNIDPNITREKNIKILENFYGADISKIIWNKDYVKIPITSIECIEEKQKVYNLTSSADNRFFAGGFFTHNCEEMDYIDEKAIRGSIYPILQTTPDTELIGFSTPTGFDTPFKKLCEKSPDFKEFHHDYMVLPWWKNVEAERSQFTEEEWEHEYLALFGSSDDSVYKKQYREAAFREYEYEGMKRNPIWKYVIGTDWNEKYGTEILVLGFNPITGLHQVVEAVRIQKAEFTQLAGVSRLIDMNKKWRPNFIYIDQGNGQTNKELLIKESRNQMFKGGDRDTARIAHILRSYDSGAAIKTKDPISRQDMKVPAKPFMVSASIRLFEQKKIILSSKDHKLKDQLQDYIIKRVTPTKTNVYGARSDKIGDHRLDALNLAIVGFFLEFSDLYTSQRITTVGAVPDPRTRTLGQVNRSRSDRMSISSNTPEERRMDHNLIGSIGQVNPSGKYDRNNRKTSRAGWATDREEEERTKYLQRRRSRARKQISRSRPTRTNI